MNLSLLFTNKHTSGSALTFAAVKVGARIAKTWWPKYQPQIEATADALESLAMVYLGCAATDAVQSAKQNDELKQQVAKSINTGDTSQLVKPSAP